MRLLFVCVYLSLLLGTPTVWLVRAVCDCFICVCSSCLSCYSPLGYGCWFYIRWLTLSLCSYSVRPLVAVFVFAVCVFCWLLFWIWAFGLQQPQLENTSPNVYCLRWGNLKCPFHLSHDSVASEENGRARVEDRYTRHYYARSLLQDEGRRGIMKSKFQTSVTNSKHTMQLDVPMFALAVTGSRLSLILSTEKERGFLMHSV